MKTLKYMALFVVAIALLVLASCTTFKASGLSYSLQAPKTTVLGDFKVEMWVNEFLGEAGGAKLFNITADATEGPVKDAIQNAIRDKGGDAAIKCDHLTPSLFCRCPAQCRHFEHIRTRERHYHRDDCQI